MSVMSQPREPQVTKVSTPATWQPISSISRKDAIAQLRIDAADEWTSEATEVLQSCTPLLYEYDKGEYLYQQLIAPVDNVKILLNPVKVFCYGCFKVVTLSKTLSSIEEYRGHVVKDHVLDQFGEYFLARYEKYKLSGATNLSDLPTPISSVDLSDTFTPTHLREIRKNAITRDLNGIHFEFYWQNWLFQLGINKTNSLSYQELSAKTEMIMSAGNKVSNWDKYPTLKLYAQKLFCSLPKRALELFRGAGADTDQKVSTLGVAIEQTQKLNHASPEANAVRLTLPQIRRDSGMNTEFVLTHISFVKDSNTKFKLEFHGSIVYPIVLVIDDLLLNPGTYVHNNKLYGFLEPIAADRLLRHREHLEEFLSRQQLISSVREYIVADYGGVLYSSGYTTFRSESYDTIRSAADLADCLKSLSACERCIKERREESCGKHSLSVPCKDCAENGVVCVSFAVFNILWDMGGDQKSKDLTAICRRLLGLDTNSNEPDDLFNFQVTYGGLHSAKALTNLIRNHHISLNGLNFSIKTLISLKKEGSNQCKELLGLIDNEAFISRDHQNDKLSYAIVSPPVEQALDSEVGCWVQRYPENFWPHKENVSQPILSAVDVTTNRNGDIFVLDPVASCLHAVDRSVVTSKHVFGRYQNGGYPSVERLVFSTSLTSLDYSDIKGVGIVAVCDAGNRCITLISKVQMLPSRSHNHHSFFSADLLVKKKTPDTICFSTIGSLLIIMEDSTVYEVILDFVAPMKVPCYKSKQRIIGLALGPVIGSITDCVLLYDVEQEMVAIVDKQDVSKMKTVPSEVFSCVKPYFDRATQRVVTSSVNSIIVWNLKVTQQSIIFEVCFEVDDNVRLDNVSLLGLWGKTVLTCSTVEMIAETCVVNIREYSMLWTCKEFVSNLKGMYLAIGYKPVNKRLECITGDLRFADAVANIDSVSEFITKFQEEKAQMFPTLHSFRGAFGSPPTGTISCIVSTASALHKIRRRIDHFKEGLSDSLSVKMLLNEAKVEHWFGNIFQLTASQGNSLPKKEWEEHRRLNAVNYILRICDAPFQQPQSNKKGYQALDTLKVSTDPVRALKTLKTLSDQFNPAEPTIKLSEREDLILQKAYKLSKPVVRASLRTMHKTQASNYATSIMRPLGNSEMLAGRRQQKGRRKRKKKTPSVSSLKRKRCMILESSSSDEPEN